MFCKLDNIVTVFGGEKHNTATNVISANATGVIDFETTVGINILGIDITSSTLSQITTAVEALLESTNSSTNLTGSSA